MLDVPTVYVDGRVGSRELAPLFPPNVRTVTENAGKALALPAGDFMWFGHGPEEEQWVLGAERKTISDFIESFVSGRLAVQVETMREMYQGRWLILEGDTRENDLGQLEMRRPGRRGGSWWAKVTNGVRPWLFDDFEQLLTSVAVGGALWIERTADPHDTARTVARLARWWFKPWEEHRTFKSARVLLDASPASMLPGKIESQRRALVRKVASQLPGIGWERAQAAADIWGTVREMINAPEESWKRLPRVGDKIARNLQEALG